MKHFIIILSVFLSQQFNFSQQDLVGLSQLWIGMNEVGPNEQVTHYIAANGAVWGQIQNGIFLVTNDPRAYNNSDISVGNYDFDHPSSWADFNWIWETGDGEAKWGLGLYKITNSKEPTAYFYLDARDSDYGNIIGFNNPDIWFYYDMGSSRFQYTYPGELDIYTGDLVRVADLLGFTYTTSGLQNFWANVLVCVSSDPEFNNVRLIWGKHPTFNCTSYKIYRSYQINPIIKYRIIATVGSSTYEYTDEETPYCGSDPVYYYIRGYNGSSYSEQSNIVSTPISKGFGKSVLDLSNKPHTYSLSQNSPNPFNSATNITYQIPEKGYVSLNVYDLLGNEITTMVNEYKEPGKNTVQFDADKLVSGIYFYRLQLRSFVETKKMLLVR